MSDKLLRRLKMYKTEFFLVVIIVLQILAAALYMRDKQFLHVDELLSFEGAHNMTLYQFGDPKYWLDSDEEWRDAWHTKEEFMRHFEVRGDESLLKHPLSEWGQVIKNKNFYYILINLMTSFQTSPAMTKWTGFALNGIILFIHQVMLYVVGKEVFGDRKKALLPVILYGFSAGALTLVTFIRVYLLKSFLCLLIAYIHVKLLSWRNLWGIVAAYGITGVSVLLIWGNQPYIVLYAVSAAFVFMLACLVQKEFRLLLKYAGVGGVGGVTVILFMKDITGQLLSYARSDYGVATITNFLKRPIKDYMVFLKFYFMKTLSHTAGGIYTIIAVAIVLAVIWRFRSRRETVRWEKFKYFNIKLYYIVGISICYFVINCRIQSVKEYRYMSCIYPGLCIGIAALLEWVLDSCRVQRRFAVISCIVLISVCVGYWRGYVDEMYHEVPQMREKLAQFPQTDNLFITPIEEERRQYYRDGYLSNDNTRLYLLSADDVDATDYKFLEQLHGKGFLCWLPILWNDAADKRALDQILLYTDYKEYETAFTTYQSEVYYVH